MSFRQWLADTAVFLLVLAVFGPYTMIPGVRTEQLAVYALLLASLGFHLWSRPRLPGAAWLIGAILLAQAVVATVATTRPLEGVGLVETSPLAGLDNVVLPLATLTVGAVVAALTPDAARLVRVALRTLILAMCANSALSLVQLEHDLTGWLAPFWTAEQDGRSVAELAAQMGRYTGVFNQPAEAGVVYGIALLGALYLYRDKTLWLMGSSVVLTVGGLVTVSKIFLLIALPIAVLQAAVWGGIRGRVLVGAGAVAMLVVVTQQSAVPIGGASLDPLLHPGESGGGLLDLYTAGRFGPNSTLKEVIDLVLEHSPWIGFGFVGLTMPYDNGLVEAIVTAGMIGAAGYLTILLILCVAWLQRCGVADPAMSRLYSGLVLVVIGGSFGLPTLTANRAATVTWLLIGLLLVAMPAVRASGDPVEDALTPVEVTVEPVPGPGGAGVGDGAAHARA